MSELTSPAPKFEVTYDITYTKNLGNFESVKVTVGLKNEGYGGPAEADRKFAGTRKWVEEHLEKALAEVSEALGG